MYCDSPSCDVCTFNVYRMADSISPNRVTKHRLILLRCPQNRHNPVYLSNRIKTIFNISLSVGTPTDCSLDTLLIVSLCACLAFIDDCTVVNIWFHLHHLEVPLRTIDDFRCKLF